MIIVYSNYAYENKNKKRVKKIDFVEVIFLSFIL